MPPRISRLSICTRNYTCLRGMIISVLEPICTIIVNMLKTSCKPVVAVVGINYKFALSPVIFGAYSLYRLILWVELEFLQRYNTSRP